MPPIPRNTKLPNFLKNPTEWAEHQTDPDKLIIAAQLALRQATLKSRACPKCALAWLERASAALDAARTILKPLARLQPGEPDKPPRAP